MRISVEIDDELMAEAMAVLGARTEQEVVERALKQYVQPYRRRRALDVLGTLHWEGDLDEMREMRTFPE